VISNFFDNFFIDLQSRGFQRYGASFALGVVSACVNYAVDALREKSACFARLRRQVNNMKDLRCSAAERDPEFISGYDACLTVGVHDALIEIGQTVQRVAHVGNLHRGGLKSK
jgi:hypothetical protein